ncbi:conserved hypothetical protein [Ricinus communis]|uniref:Uncharacterized protein n=1 Tax=Ricinus communis TaxID=3988 RepID=B9RRZ2_RICCO|nr:conserved hypothetical protein [Ricinus communis]
MASRYRSITNSSLTLLKSTVNRPTLKPNSIPSLLSSRSSLTCSRQDYFLS